MKGDVLFDEISRVLFSTAACMYQVEPLGVVVPANPDDVVSVVRYCSERGISITSRGAGTSLAGQSVGAGIVLVFNKYFKNIGRVDRDSRSVDVQAGVTLHELNKFLIRENLMFGPDPSSGKQCVIGGMVATNASGAHSLKYGATKDNVNHLNLVTSGGEIISTDRSLHTEELEKRLHRLLSPHREVIDSHFPKSSKNSCGYNLKEAITAGGVDLTRLLCGSEGTLGITLEANLKLAAIPGGRRNLIAYFQSHEDCANAAIESLSFSPAAVEMLDKTFANAAAGIDPEVDRILREDFSSILIFEFEENSLSEADDKIVRLSTHLQNLHLTSKLILPRDDKEAAKLWRVRKEASSIFYKIEKPGKKVSVVEDVAVPVEMLPAYLEKVRKIFQGYDLQYALYGHAGNGNTHAIVLLDLKEKKYLDKLDSLARDVYDLAISLKGTMSGEHGDGFLRTPFLSLMYGDEVYSLFKSVKEVFDPQSILNPGKIVGEQSASIVHDLRYGERYKRIDTGTSINDERIAHEIEKCHGCGVCLSYCPTALATGDERATPRAKGNLLRGILSGRIGAAHLEDPAFKEVLDYCFNCKLCLTECPTAIDIPGIVVEAKTIFHERVGGSAQDRFINMLPAMSAAASVTPTFASIAANLKSIRKPIERLFGIDSRRTLPIFHKPLYKRFGVNRSSTNAQAKVIYFSGCFANFNDVSGEGLATIEVLRRNNIDVRILDSLRCCGIAKFTTGSRNENFDDASWNVEQLSKYVDDGFDIVVSAPSCGLALKDDYPQFLATTESRNVSSHVFELSEYLMRLSRSGKLNKNFGPVESRVTYHNPCHSIPLGVRNQPIELLKLIPNLEVVELREDTCCGMAGTFGLKKQFFDLSMKVGSNLFAQIEEARVDAVVTTCGTCNIQIKQGANTNVTHLAEIMFQSYRNFSGPMTRQPSSAQIEAAAQQKTPSDKEAEALLE